MAKRASGKYAYLIDDRSGRKIRYKDARTEWNGLRVYKKDWEPKHPQLTPPKLGPEATSLENPRPDSDNVPTTVRFGIYGSGYSPPAQVAFGSISIAVREEADSLIMQTAFSIPTIATGYTLIGEALSSTRGSVTINTAEDADSQLLQTALGSFSFSAQENVAGQSATTAKGSPTFSASSTADPTGQSLASAHGAAGLNFSGTEVPAGQELTSGIGSLTFQSSSTITSPNQSATTGIGTPTINTGEDVNGLQLSTGFGTISIAIDNTGWGADSWGANAWGT
jgi:hypothetical protein